LIGFAGYFVSTGEQLLGIKLSRSSLASLVNSMNPVAISVFAAIFLKEKLTLKKGMGIILSIFGIYMTIGGGDSNGHLLGILVSTFSVLTWVEVSILVSKMASKYEALQITAYGIFIAAVCNFPFYFYELSLTQNIHFNWIIILSFLYMGLICTALAYVFWNKSLSLIEAGTCSMFYPVQPLVSVLLGWMLLDENINLNFFIGTILVLSGVLLSIINIKQATRFFALIENHNTVKGLFRNR
jgi:drug/metabolite transporter (DMT)-like permease